MAPSLFQLYLSRLRKCKGGWMYQETNVGEPVRGTIRNSVALRCVNLGEGIPKVMRFIRNDTKDK